MSIDATSSVTSTSRASYQQIRSDFKTLQNDLQSGSLANAQVDFATLLKDAPQLNNQLQSGATATTQTSDLSALSTSLQSGDLTGAKAALGSLGQDLGFARNSLSSMGQVHRHHHHHHADSDSATAGNASGDQAVQSDFQALSSALQSGNITSAQQALAQLQKDDPQFATLTSPIATPATLVA